MESFVKLTVLGKTGKRAERVFNLRYLKAFEPSSCTVLLVGNLKPFMVTQESAALLLRACGISEADGEAVGNGSE